MPGCPCANKVVPEGMDDIARDRKCTDILWFALFLVFWVGMLVIGILGFQQGDPQKLIYGKNYEEKVCGSNGLGKYVHYPRINEDLFGLVTGGELPTNLDAIKFYGVCMDACPKNGDWVCDDVPPKTIYTDKKLDECLSKTVAGGGAFLHKDPGIAMDSVCQLGLEHCWKTEMDMKSIFFRCMPLYNTTEVEVEVCENPAGAKPDSDECTKKTVTTVTQTIQPAKKNPVFDKLNSAAGAFLRIFADIQKAQMAIIVSGVLGGVLFGFLWLMLLRYCAHVVVWLTIACLLALMITLTIFSYGKAGIIGENEMATVIGSGSEVAAYASATESSNDMWKYTAYVMTALTGIYFVVIMVMRKKISIAIGIIQEASKAVAKMKSLLLFPFSTITSLTILVLWFLIVTAYLMSAENIVLTIKKGSAGNLTLTNATNPDQLIPTTDNTFHYLMAYHFFGLLWTNQVNISFGIMAVSGAVASWYFAGPHDGNSKNSEENIQEKLGSTPLFSSIVRTCLYHLGTICAGSFMIAFVQFLRAILAYIESKTKELQGKNPLLKLLMKCIACILYCFEKSVKYVSRLAFIQTAIKGTNFCSSAIASMGFMFKEAALVGVITSITDIVMSMGKGCIAMFTGVIANLWIQYLLPAENKVSSSAIPTLLTMMFGFALGTACLEVYETAIDTILLCFCMDKEQNEKLGKMKAGAHLQEFVSQSAKKAAQLDGKGDGSDVGGGGAASSGKKESASRKPAKVEIEEEEEDFL
jgi:solute carrier family 44 (choline transporter-like protein), member 2/4/5